MKNNIYILAAFLLMSSLSFSQNNPIDFEDGGHGADWTWAVFENDDNPALEIVDNPDATVNTSSTVAKFTARTTGNPYAGCESLHGTDIGEYQITESNSTITILVYKTRISDVGIKLVTASGWAKPEVKVANTKVNEWEKLTFDFSTVDHEGMTYDQIVVFPDFLGDRAEDQIIYFDNIVIGDAEVNSVKTLTASEVSVYPNPANNLVEVAIENGSIENITVLNLTGQSVLEQNTNSATLDVSMLATGVFTIQVTTSLGQSVQRLIIK